MLLLPKFLRKKKPATDFADFFRNASAAEKVKLFRRVVRKASEDQRAVMKKYNQVSPKTT